MGDNMMKLLDSICSMVWGRGLTCLIIVTGIIFTCRLRFIQFRALPYIIRNRANDNSGLSQRKTVCMSLGAAMGTGNITGAASAVAIGGSGAVFWMWISAFLGMAVVYAENNLSSKYSSNNSCGPMAYIENGLGSRKLAFVYAALCLCSALGMGGMIQVNAVTEIVCRSADINKYVIALFAFALIFLITSGGAERIGSAAQSLLPAASILYAVGCVIVLFINRSRLPDAFTSVFSNALGIRQAAGGITGYGISKAVSIGLRRGIFSNEAGLGTSPILHSAAKASDVKLQGMWAMTEVFIDTVICCSLTAFTVICGSEDMTVSNAFASVFSSPGAWILAVETAIFALCTIIGQFYCFKTAYSYITGNEGSKNLSIMFAVISSIGAVAAVPVVWTVSDIFNGLMAFPNLLALLWLRKKVNK